MLHFHSSLWQWLKTRFCKPKALAPDSDGDGAPPERFDEKTSERLHAHLLHLTHQIEALQDALAHGRPQETATAQARVDTAEEQAPDGAEAEREPAENSGEQEETQNEGSRYLPTPRITVWHKDNLDRLIKNSEPGGERRALLLARDKSNKKFLAPYPGYYLRGLGVLDEEFANFRAVTQFFREHYYLSSVADERVQFPPVLLDGPPGVGKTAYLQKLASLWNMPLVTISVGSQHSGFFLTGLDRGYTGASTGLLYDTLVEGLWANPAFFLDELDKTSELESSHLHNTLLTLLEKGTASQFKDACLPDVPMDASHCLWIASCNDYRQLPDPLLSRFTLFKVPSPTQEERMHIAGYIYRNLRNDNVWGPAMSETLAEDVRRTLTEMEPRTIRKVLESACARAISQGRREIVAADLDVAQARYKKRGIGF